MVNTSVAPLTADPLTERPLSPQARCIIALLRVVGCIPFSIRSALGASIGYIVGLVPFREAEIARLHLSLFFPTRNSRELTASVFSNVARNILESLNLKPLTAEPFSHISCDNWDHVASLTKDDRPLIALTGHTGNWDLLAAYCIARGIPISTVGKEARNPHLQATLKHLRDSYGIETIWRSDKSGVKRIVSCFKDRRVMAALIDQDTRVESLQIPFFGIPAKTPSALIELGKRYNARFVSAFIVRTKGTRFKIFVEEIPDTLSAEGVLAEYNARLERIIREYPSQWVWFHKRWRSKSDGTTLSTREYLSWLRSQLPK
jgi:KDO2-lipid IV(A) lauroyltransferase